MLGIQLDVQAQLDLHYSRTGRGGSMAESRLTHNSEETSFKKLLETRCYYTIPPFQRAYKWRKQNLEQLMSDVVALIEEQEDAHFMGALILDQLPSSPSAPSIYEVIDGQQRLTTVFIMIAGIVRALLKEKEMEKASEIALNYLFTRESTNQLKSRLVPSLPDQGDLNMVLDDLWNSGLGESLSSYVFIKLPTNDVNDGRIKRNYDYFRGEFFKEYRTTGIDRVLTLLEAALEKLTLVQIVVKDPTSGPKIFDSLNSKQEPMTTGDLVRNEIFNKIARSDPSLAQDLDRQLWQPFYTSFKRDGEDTFEGFFFPYGLIVNSQFKKSEVYPGLRKMWQDLSPSEVIDQLSSYKGDYQDLVFGTNTINHSREISKRISRFHRMGLIKAALPFLMSVSRAVRVQEISEIEACELLDITEAFLVRRAICSLEPTGLHAVFKKLWKDLNGEYSRESFRKVLQDARTVSNPSDDDVRTAFDRPFYQKSVSRYFLIEYETSRGGDTANVSAVPMWIEHVLPNSLHAKNWPQFQASQHEKYKDFVGNLLPLSEEMNRDLGQAAFDRKRVIFKEDSHYKSTREFAENYKNWDVESLLERNSMLAAWALTRWVY